MKKTMLLAGMLLILAGCLKTEIIDPNTGRVTTAYQLDPNAIKAIEDRTQQAQAIAAVVGAGAGAATPIFPWAATLAGAATTIAGILGTAIAVLKKIKPQLTEAQSKQQMYYSTTESVVTAIEDFKAAYPEEWAKLKEKLVAAIGPEAENIIRALRGLPSKT